MEESDTFTADPAGRLQRGNALACEDNGKHGDQGGTETEEVRSQIVVQPVRLEIQDVE